MNNIFQYVFLRNSVTLLKTCNAFMFFLQNHIVLFSNPEDGKITNII